jgi:hypothetical protein
MTKEAVVKQFLWDLLENSGEDYDREGDFTNYDKEEANWILADLFFAGLLEIAWNPKTKTLLLEYLEKPLRTTQHQLRKRK